MVILHNGTVLRGHEGKPGPDWPGPDVSGSFVSKVQLGPMGEIQETAVSGGVVYVPNKRGHILILNPKTSPGGKAHWQVLSVSGEGEGGEGIYHVVND